MLNCTTSAPILTASSNSPGVMYTIRENSLIGIGAIVLNRAKIGKNCLVGAGAMVTEGKEIPDGSLVLGVNKVMRQLTPEEIAMNTWIADHYAERAERYRKGLKAIG